VARLAYLRPSAEDTPAALPLNAAAREWARMTGTSRPHRSTIMRWCVKGCRGVRLCGRRSGNGWVVTPEALAEFHARINERPATSMTVPEANPARAAEIATALGELDKLIGLEART
jgi:hypothetical protein